LSARNFDSIAAHPVQEHPQRLLGQLVWLPRGAGQFSTQRPVMSTAGVSAWPCAAVKLVLRSGWERAPVVLNGGWSCLRWLQPWFCRR